MTLLTLHRKSTQSPSSSHGTAWTSRIDIDKRRSSCSWSGEGQVSSFGTDGRIVKHVTSLNKVFTHRWLWKPRYSTLQNQQIGTSFSGWLKSSVWVHWQRVASLDAEGMGAMKPRSTRCFSCRSYLWYDNLWTDCVNKRQPRHLAFLPLDAEFINRSRRIDKVGLDSKGAAVSSCYCIRPATHSCSSDFPAFT